MFGSEEPFLLPKEISDSPSLSPEGGRQVPFARRSCSLPAAAPTPLPTQDLRLETSAKEPSTLHSCGRPASSSQEYTQISGLPKLSGARQTLAGGCIVVLGAARGPFSCKLGCLPQGSPFLEEIKEARCEGHNGEMRRALTSRACR